MHRHRQLCGFTGYLREQVKALGSALRDVAELQCHGQLFVGGARLRLVGFRLLHPLKLARLEDSVELNLDVAGYAGTCGYLTN